MKTLAHMLIAVLATALILWGCGERKAPDAGVELNDDQVEEIVRRSYPYVALYNVINKAALDAGNPAGTGGWNRMNVATELFDHNVKMIARPNNDTLYITCMMDLRKDPVILKIPAFDSKHVSLMAVAYDHYVNMPMSVTKGDFRNPETVLFYSDHTDGYAGEPIEGVDRSFEMSGDFVIVAFRVMPHAKEPERFERIRHQMQSIEMRTLSEFRGGEAKEIDDIEFPAFGATDGDVFEDNLVEVMQFVFNHTIFDPDNEIDRAALAAWAPLGVAPGGTYDAAKAAGIDGRRFRAASRKVAEENFALLGEPAEFARISSRLARPKDEADFEAQLVLSVIGPIGMPNVEAVYPPVSTTDGKPMNARNDYVVRMTPDEMPPARAFWSLTLYDMENGFFIPNDRKKYSVGENAGMKLNEDGGIEIYVAAEKPDGVPDENWLPINRKDEIIDIILRVYAPDLEKMKTWTAPRAEMLP